jgi:hypothetical protein
MLDADNDTEQDYTVLLDHTSSSTPQPLPAPATHPLPVFTKAPMDKPTHRSDILNDQRPQTAIDLSMTHKNIEHLIKCCSLNKTDYWLVKWPDSPQPRWHMLTSLLRVPNWKSALRAYENQQPRGSINTVSCQTHHTLYPIWETPIENTPPTAQLAPYVYSAHLASFSRGRCFAMNTRRTYHKKTIINSLYLYVSYLNITNYNCKSRYTMSCLTHKLPDAPARTANPHR